MTHLNPPDAAALDGVKNELEFVAAAMGFEPKYNNVSCGCLKDTNPLRRLCIRLVHNAYFEIFIINLF